MTSRPMLYSAAMILAKLAGRKTQTRRLVTLDVDPDARLPNLDAAWIDPSYLFPATGNVPCLKVPYGSGESIVTIRHFPRWEPGDLLWCQENYRIWLPEPRAGMEVWCRYEADGAQALVTLTPREWELAMSRKCPPLPGSEQSALAMPVQITPGRFMYRSLSRLTDQIVSVRCERLNNISEADAIAEGIESKGGGWKNYFDDGPAFDDPRMSYLTLWGAIHGLGSWERDKDKFVWVIETKPLEGGAP